MTFDQTYRKLEEDFRQRVEEDNKRWKFESIFLPNVEPTGPVDYVLIGMEPSLGGWAKDVQDAQRQIDEGFRNFCGVWILHHPVRNYLCPDGETYYVTDLAKGAMLTNQKGDESEKKYDEWYPLLEKELGLVAKPHAKIISIGNRVGRFLSERGLYGHVGTIPHYSGRAARYWGREITDEKRKSDYRKFAAGIQTVSGSSCSPNHVWERDCESEEATPTETQKRLMFDYKIRFERIQEQERSGWKYWQLKWERQMTST